MDPGIDFEFTATFDVFPTVELANFDRVNVKRPSAEIEDADLETMIARLRERTRPKSLLFDLRKRAIRSR